MSDNLARVTEQAIKSYLLADVDLQDMDIFVQAEDSEITLPCIVVACESLGERIYETSIYNISCRVSVMSQAHDMDVNTYEALVSDVQDVVNRVDLDGLAQDLSSQKTDFKVYSVIDFDSADESEDFTRVHTFTFTLIAMAQDS